MPVSAPIAALKASLAVPRLRRLAVAFSGGLDSRFLCRMALDAGCDVLALHVTGPHIPAQESEGARDFARTQGLRLAELTFNPLGLDEVRHTGRMRCYACKKAMMQALKSFLAHMGEQDRPLCDGSNADDAHCYRPGSIALKEEGILSPLAQAGVSKAMLRAEAERIGMPLPELGSRPCLLTRYAYGLEPTLDGLRAIERAESVLAGLRDGQGRALLSDFRLRMTPAPVLQIQGAVSAQTAHAALDAVRKAGFGECTLTICEHVSGWFDKAAKA